MRRLAPHAALAIKALGGDFHETQYEMQDLRV